MNIAKLSFKTHESLLILSILLQSTNFCSVLILRSKFPAGDFSVVWDVFSPPSLDSTGAISLILGANRPSLASILLQSTVHCGHWKRFWYSVCVPYLIFFQLFYYTGHHWQTRYDEPQSSGIQQQLWYGNLVVDNFVSVNVTFHYRMKRDCTKQRVEWCKGEIESHRKKLLEILSINQLSKCRYPVSMMASSARDLKRRKHWLVLFGSYNTWLKQLPITTKV